MRNLKRTLSLALAAVMLMGMMVIGAGAASSDFTDASKIKNVEAVDVMVALGVLQGGDKGDFQPNSILTREQAAKIICYLLLGEESAEKLTTNSTVFKDVAADRWSAPYIGYCVNLGILAGDGNGNFFPEGKLNGAAFGKMLLVALGYDPTIEKYVGTDWMINVASDVIEAGISPKGLVLSDELSRQDAAQMAFQTLTANMVKYSNKGTVINNADGSSIVIGNTPAEAVKVDGERSDNYAGAKGDGEGYQQFCEKYFPDLKKTSGESDDFGRDAIIWKNGKPAKEIGTYAVTADLVYTEAVKGGDLYKDLGKPTMGTLTVYNDGKKDTTVPAGFAIAKDNEKTIGGNGTLVEVFTEANTADSEKTDVTIVVINTYYGEVSAVTPAKGDDARTVTVAGMKYETEEFAKEDPVLYTKADGKIQTLTAPDTFTGKVTSKSSKGTFVVDGTTYEWGTKGNASSIEVKSEYDFYTDSYGYVVAAKVVKEADAQYAVVLDYKDKAWTTDSTQEVKLVLADGTVTTVSAEGKDKAAISDMKGQIVAYTVDDDVYTLEKVGTGLTASTIKTGNATIDGTTDYNANSKTIFVVRGGEEGDYTYTSYTGIANVPNLESAAGKIYVKDDVAQFVYITTSTEVGTDADELTYINFTDAETVKDETGTYKICNAVVDGEITTVKVSTDATVVTATGLYKSLTYNKDGIITKGVAAIKAPTTNYDYTEATGTTADNNGLIILGGKGYGYASDVAVYKVDDEGVITSAAISDIETDVNDVVLFTTNKDGIVTSLYLVPVANGSVSSVIDAIANGTAGVDGTMIATPVVDGSDVTMMAPKDYTTTKDGSVMQISADLARFLGGLHNAGVTTIEYKSVSYTWDPSSAGNLNSSNWYGDGKTLVKAITDDWKGADTNWGGKDDAPYTATLVVNGVTMTYTVK